MKANVRHSSFGIARTQSWLDLAAQLVLPLGGHAPSMCARYSAPGTLRDVSCADTIGVWQLNLLAIDSETAVDASGQATVHYCWHEPFNTRPKCIMESLIHNPIEVVRENANVSILTQWRIGNEVDALASSDDSLALLRVEDVCSYAETRHDRMRRMCSRRRRGRQRNGVGCGGI